MAKIKLIVTGDLEKSALHKSLRKHFPAKRDGEDVIWDLPRRLHCATSYPLLKGGVPSRPMVEIAKAMFVEAGIGKNSVPADLVIVLDDVELGNLGRESVIAEHFRSAVNQQLSTYDMRTQERYRSLLREKCSYHLLKPMVESYFFGDANALHLAGVQPGQVPKLVDRDVEAFQTNDPAWLPTCEAENALRWRKNTPWWCHERHPKHYLEHLTARGNVFYEETEHGEHALTKLLWNQVPKSASDTPLIRSLFEDISDWFHVPNPFFPGSFHPDLYPSKSVDRSRLCLRNL